MIDPYIKRIADELEGAGWSTAADDLREGVSIDTVLAYLREDGEGDSEAVEIITYHPATEEG